MSGLSAIMKNSVPAIAILLFCMACRPALGEQVGKERLDEKTFSGIVRCMGRCDVNDAIDLGMRITGSEPAFDERFDCRGIDDGWAIDYSGKRGRSARHGGIDIPAPRGTPILAIADGEVVAMFDNHETAVGVRVFLQHSPEQTGKPFWTYSEYAHLLELPPLAVGQKIKRGDEVGKTSNTGISGLEARARASGSSGSGGGKMRRFALHFSIMYSDSPDHVVLPRNGGYLVPVGGRWMDPVAFYRGAGPYESAALAAVPPGEKTVQIPFLATDGSTFPPSSKLIWPYACTPK